MTEKPRKPKLITVVPRTTVTWDVFIDDKVWCNCSRQSVALAEADKLRKETTR